MQIIPITIAEFCRVSGLEKTTAYQLINQGKRDVAMIGVRTLIKPESVHALVEQSLVKKGAE